MVVIQMVALNLSLTLDTGQTLIDKVGGPSSGTVKLEVETWDPAFFFFPTLTSKSFSTVWRNSNYPIIYEKTNRENCQIN